MRELYAPYCGSRNIARIFRGKVILGGCEVEGIYPLPRYHCNDCEEEF